MTFVIQSESEEGYWSNETGWGSLEGAEHFDDPPATLPCIGNSDARVVLLGFARENRMD